MTPHQEGPRREPYSIQRLEAFSDGVFAIAITLLILDVRVPRDLPQTTRLADAMLAAWPNYFAFLTSFATIGIMWMNHHRLFRIIARADHALLIWNGLLLLGITFVPFPTALIAEYIQRPDQRTAAMVLGGTYVFLALMFNGLWWHAAPWAPPPGGRRGRGRGESDLEIVRHRARGLPDDVPARPGERAGQPWIEPAPGGLLCAPCQAITTPLPLEGIKEDLTFPAISPL